MERPDTDMPCLSHSEALDILFATNNPSNDRRIFRRLYKYHKLFHIADTPPSSDGAFVTHENGKDYYVFNPFLLALLRDAAVWFSPASSFNDPWDAGNAIAVLGGDELLKARIVEQIFTDSERGSFGGLDASGLNALVEERVRAIFRSIRFACFSLNRESAPMWAHYADDNRGVCLAFEFFRWNKAAAVHTVDWNFRAGYKVRYEGDYAEISDITDFASALTALYTKKPEWKYEQEVRFMKLANAAAPEAGGIVTFKRRSLTHVILGSKVPSALALPLRRILDGSDYEHVTIVRTVFNPRTKSYDYEQFVPRKA